MGIEPATGRNLDKLVQLAAVTREFYGTNPDNKPNNHCNWERLLPTTDSPFGWVENDEHLRKRMTKKATEEKDG